jgi:hypothetical protein
VVKSITATLVLSATRAHRQPSSHQRLLLPPPPSHTKT